MPDVVRDRSTATKQPCAGAGARHGLLHRAQKALL